MCSRAGRIEDRWLRDRDSIAKGLSFDAVAAWRLFAWDAPSTPTEEVFTADEIHCVSTINRVHLLPAAERGAASPRDVLGMALARVTGWHPTKRRPLPGNDVLWRASQRIQPMVEVYQSKRHTWAWDAPSASTGRSPAA